MGKNTIVKNEPIEKQLWAAADKLRGLAGFVLAKGSLTSKTSGEGEIRKALIEARLVDCVVNLPAKLFLNTQIPASLWFLRRGKTYRQNEILFIDACNLGHLINRRTKEFSEAMVTQMWQVFVNQQR